jgi:hypothetical protein
MDCETIGKFRFVKIMGFLSNRKKIKVNWNKQEQIFFDNGYQSTGSAEIS